jgi:hypothetical protein
MRLMFMEVHMPLESIVIVGAIIALFLVFAGALSWVWWYTDGSRLPKDQGDAPAE